MIEQHTPGPWELEDRGYKYIVSKPGDGYITRDVCCLDSSTMCAFNQRANAYLIIAAPDLLAAAKAALQVFVNQGWEHDLRAAKDLKRAIAKAEGGAA